MLEFTINPPDSLKYFTRHEYDIPIEGLDFDRRIRGGNQNHA